MPFSEKCYWRFGMQGRFFGDGVVPNVWSSRLLVFRVFVGRRLRVYNGKKFFPILVKRHMVGLKLGEFRVTKVISGSVKIHGRKKQKQKLSKRMKRE